MTSGPEGPLFLEIAAFRGLKAPAPSAMIQASVAPVTDEYAVTRAQSRLSEML
jgi:hypothetical protein